MPQIKCNKLTVRGQEVHLDFSGFGNDLSFPNAAYARDWIQSQTPDDVVGLMRIMLMRWALANGGINAIEGKTLTVNFNSTNVVTVS